MIKQRPPKLTTKSVDTSSVAGREVNIKTILEKCKKNKVKFKNITHASIFVAAELGGIENIKISPVTLRRNVIYRLHLESYIDSYAKKAIGTDQREILDLKMAIRELQLEKNGYAKQISRQAERILAIEYLVDSHQVDILLANEVTSPMKLNDRYYSILESIMVAAKGFSVELNNGRVTDDATEITMFTEDDLPGYFEWYRKRYNN